MLSLTTDLFVLAPLNFPIDHEITQAILGGRMIHNLLLQLAVKSTLTPRYKYGHTNTHVDVFDLTPKNHIHYDYSAIKELGQIWIDDHQSFVRA